MYFAYHVALHLYAPHAALVTYGQSWWSSYCEWMVPSTDVAEEIW